jgi:hypothetical protein
MAIARSILVRIAFLLYPTICSCRDGTSRPFQDRYDPATHIIAMPKAVRKEQDGGFIKNETRGTMKP